jgi:zinc protease
MMKSIPKKILLNLATMILLPLAQLTHAALPIQKIPLDSGATLFFVEARTIPMINIGVDIKAGSVFDPKGKVGVADFAANLLNKGAMVQGVKKDEAFLSDKISDLGAIFNANVSNELTSIRIKSLSKSSILDEVISVSAEMIANPSFEQKILSREKSLEVSGLLESQTRPEYLMSEQFTKMLYQGNPLGKMPSVEDIKKIEVQDLRKFHQSYYRAKNTNVIIVGDVTAQIAIQIANRLTQKMPKGPDIELVVPPFKTLPVKSEKEREVHISHPSTQAHIQMGIDSVPRNHPDYFPLLVGNYILGGGGFVSRLMNEIREKRGLAYSVSSYFIPSKYSGFFSASMQTKKEQSDQAVQLLNQTIGEFVKNGPREDEIIAAQSNLVNGFALRIDSNNKLLENVANIAWNDLPLNTLDTWTTQIQKVTKEDIQRVFKKYLDSERMITVVVGGN